MAFNSVGRLLLSSVPIWQQTNHWSFQLYLSMCRAHLHLICNAGREGCNDVKVDTEIHSQNITVSSGPQTHWLAHIMKADLINYEVWKHRNQDILKCRTHHQRQALYWINIYDLLRASEFFSLKESFSTDTISRSCIDQTAQPLANHSFPTYLVIELPITCPYMNNISKIITLNFNDW